MWKSGRCTLIGVIDCGLSNTGSIINMVGKVGFDAAVLESEQQVLECAAIILPGVGSFDVGIGNLKSNPIFDAVQEQVQSNGVPILGICLGMQLLFEGSEEGSSTGLGWIPGEVKKFDFCGLNIGESPKVPHMGWNTVVPSAQDPLFAHYDEPPRFYFVHSYHAVCRDSADSIGTSEYGYEFTSAVRKGNIVGMQFHPEKSHKFGIQFFRNFLGGL